MTDMNCAFKSLDPFTFIKTQQHIRKKRVNDNLRQYFICNECIVKYEECNQIHILFSISNKHRYVWTKRIFIHFSWYFLTGQSIPDLGIQSVYFSFFIFSHFQANLDLANSVNFSLYFIYQKMFRVTCIVCQQILFYKCACKSSKFSEYLFSFAGIFG